MLIRSLEVENFHNHKKLHIDFGTKTTNVYGANGVGKTSIMDAVNFLLYGKDSQGRTNTAVRPYDVDGNLMHDLETSVKAVFEDENGVFTMQVIYKENWTKISGTDERKLMGNTTEYYIDGIPKKAKEYQSFVEKTFAEPWFSITTNPNYFPNLKWQDQRAILMKFVGDVSIDDILLREPELEDIREDLLKFSAADLQKKWAKEKKVWDGQLKSIPARIDELSRLIVEDVPQREEIEKSIAEAEEKRYELLESKAALENGNQHAVLKAQLTELIGLRDKVERGHADMVQKVRDTYNAERAKITEKINNNNNELRFARQQYLNVGAECKNLAAELKKIGAEWNAVDSETFNQDKCPHCGRPYTEDMLEGMKAAFNRSKADRLQKCQEKGDELNQKYLKKREEYKVLMDKANELGRYEQEVAPNEIAEINAMEKTAIAELPKIDTLLEPSSGLTYAEIMAKANKVRNELQSNTANSAVNEVVKQLIAVDSAISMLRGELAKYDLNVQNRIRIEQLTDEKKSTMEAVGIVERKMALLGKFVVAKIKYIDNAINEKFEKVSFKLFEKNIGNEGIKETCELVMHGVPYRNLSFAERHIAGMDVIKTISKAYGYANPVFIDNRESITNLPEPPGQVINLVVSAEDKKLRIVKENE